MKEKIFTNAVEAADIVIFGASGDLASRKIWPALYHRLKEGQLPSNSCFWAVNRKEISQEEFLNFLEKGLKEHLPIEDWDLESWGYFKQKVTHVFVETDQKETFQNLKRVLTISPLKIRVFYLATPSSAFVDICHQLYETQLITENSRVVLEKPLGNNLESFQKLNDGVLKYFEEKQIYRIDHYLGKETVQNLMVLRFANNMFERIWNADSIDHVQITVAESVGLEGRIEYFDGSGSLRDMVQNHLLQLLCLVAMEPPVFLDADSVRTEKLKVLLALEPLKDLQKNSVRGQYRAGSCSNEPVLGYTEELGKDSQTETFVAIRAKINNWRWSQVPFYLRTGKRLAQRCSEIVIQFKTVPHHIFPLEQKPFHNKLIIRLQPDESIKLQMTAKSPGPGGYRLKNVGLNLSLAEAFDERFPEAYERLLMDVIRGNATLFMRSDEVEAAWKWIDQIENGWRETNQSLAFYSAGSWGPDESIALVAQDLRHWHKE